MYFLNFTALQLQGEKKKFKKNGPTTKNIPTDSWSNFSSLKYEETCL